MKARWSSLRDKSTICLFFTVKASSSRSHDINKKFAAKPSHVGCFSTNHFKTLLGVPHASHTKGNDNHIASC